MAVHLRTATVDQDTGVRGFDQTGSEEFLEPFERSRRDYLRMPPAARRPARRRPRRDFAGRWGGEGFVILLPDKQGGRDRVELTAVSDAQAA